MDKQAFSEQWENYRLAIEDFLGGLFTEEKPYGVLYDAMRYSLLSGGKRLRPTLTLEFARLCGLDWRKALAPACALEMIHTYSLIHDDLPCMDDDGLRRGKPTNHVVYGETIATLAGDALQPEAFRVILSAQELPEVQRARCAASLAKAAGADGMVAGQVLDLTNISGDEEKLRLLHALKTGAMIIAAAEMGCFAADAEAMLPAARAYASALGTAFQIRDDMLDVIGDETTFGKPIGSDSEEGKTTFVDLLGIDGCAREVDRLTEQAIGAVSGIAGNEFLVQMAKTLATREK